MPDEIRKPHHRFKTGQVHDDYRHHLVKPSDLTLKERDERRMAYFAMRDIDRLMGDPPPGYSALDRKR